MRLILFDKTSTLSSMLAVLSLMLAQPVLASEIDDTKHMSAINLQHSAPKPHCSHMANAGSGATHASADNTNLTTGTIQTSFKSLTCKCGSNDCSCCKHLVTSAIDCNVLLAPSNGALSVTLHGLLRVSRASTILSVDNPPPIFSLL